MPEYDQDIQTKIELLREISNNFSAPIEVYQLVKISWKSPDGAIYYAATEVQAIEDSLPIEPVEIRLPVESYPDYFLPVSSDSSMGDEEIELKLWDADDEISRLVYENGEGVPTEVLMWFPAVELLISVFHGHLRTSEDSDVEFWLGRAANGFRSPDLPLPRRAHYSPCQAAFGVWETGCTYDRHRGGSTGNLQGNGQPFTSCPKKQFGHCIERLGDKLSHLSHQSVTESIINNQTKGPQLLATSRGNETNLKRPVRVILGVRYCRDLDLMAAIPLYNNNNPDKGFWRMKFELCEGPIRAVVNSFVGGQHCQSGQNAIHYALRGGELRQPPTAFTPGVHNYSYTAHFDYTFGWINPSSTKADSIKAEAHIEGLNDVKQYYSETQFVTGCPRTRAWHIFRMLTDKRWGYGLDESRISIPAFIELAIWGDTLVGFTDPLTGEFLQHVRSMSDFDLQERSVQQQIEDAAWAGRFSRPFIFGGKLHIVPLKALSELELDAAPYFTDSDEYGAPNIIFEDGKTTVRRSQISDEDLPNRVELTYDRGLSLNLETVISVEDEEAQLRAGKLLGDSTRRVVAKKESALGTTNDEQALKLAWTILDLGKFDEGGLKNNLQISFKAWFLDCLDLHPFKVIQVYSKKLERYGFEWFRIKKINRLPNLQVEIIAQAYNKDYMDALEIELAGPGGIYQYDPVSDIIPLDYGSISYQNGFLEIEIIEGS